MQNAPQQQTGESQSIDVPLDLSQVNQTDGASCVDASSVDPAPVVQLSDDELIASLAAMTTLEYERARVAQAKLMGCRPAALDVMVRQAKNQEDEPSIMPFPEVAPHPEPISPSGLLTALSLLINLFIVLDKEQADAAALWIAMTWFMDVIDVAPLAIINAPEKSCGKSQMLDLFGRMVARPLSAANSSTAFLFRSLELWQPTMLIDEADTFVRENDELKGIINAGYTRSNAFVGRVVGDSHEPKLFKVWGAKAMAGITLERHLPDATMSRAILFDMRRKLSHERVTKLRDAEEGVFDDTASKLARFADDYRRQVRLARPVMPESMSDRAQDNWQALFAIASCAGDEWVARAKAAALKLSNSGQVSVSTGNELLADIQHVFERRFGGKISTVQLIEALCADEENGWATYNRGKPLSPRQLAKQLATYGISSKTVRLGPGNTPKGFDADQFADVFSRYLAPPEKLPQLRNDVPESLICMASGVADKTQHSRHVDATGAVAVNPPQNSIRNDAATPDPLIYMDCGGVAAEMEILTGSQFTPVGAYPDSAF